MAEPFYHVFRLPGSFPSEYCFGAGVPVNFQMVDWFGAAEGTTREATTAFIRKKQYAIGRLLVIERGGDTWIIEARDG